MSVSVSYQAVGLLLTSLLVCGGGVAAYVDVKSDIAVVETKIDAAQDTKRQVDKNRESIVKTEARQEGIEKTQNRLERTMDEILKEMKLMNDNLIRLEPK
jgi:uncharacterized protein (DUF3084 family)